MSDIARLWSRSLKGGLNVAEHAVCRELGEHHNSETGLCFPSLDTICDIYECSRIYLGQVLTRLENWQLITRIEWFESEKSNRQTSNRYRLNLARHFPDPFPEGRQTHNKNPNATTRPYDARDFAALLGASQGRKFLRMVHNYCRKDTTLVSGIKEGFFQKAKQRVGKKQPPAILWLAIESQTHLDALRELLPEVQAHIRREGLSEPRESTLPLEIKLTPLFYVRGKKKL